jgi:hypothetical protein
MLLSWKTTTTCGPTKTAVFIQPVKTFPAFHGTRKVMAAVGTSETSVNYYAAQDPRKVVAVFD